MHHIPLHSHKLIYSGLLCTKNELYISALCLIMQKYKETAYVERMF